MSVLPIIIAYAILLLSAWILSRWLPPPSAAGRFASLDGIRGYLAFGVFLHHSCIWYFYLHTGKWEVPPSHIYTNLGQASVCLFFMITAFLFWSKLLRGRAEPINWYKLYLSRLLRLVPLYMLVVGLICFTVALVSHFHIRRPFHSLLSEVIRWSSFTLLGSPNINGVENTYRIVAGVVWSLEYEWLFYVALPVMGLIVGASAPRRLIVVSLIGAAYIYYRIKRNEELYFYALWAFGGGIIAAYLAKLDRVRAFAAGHGASLVAVAALGAAMICFPSAYGILPLILLTIAFVLIAAGNTCFGVLTWGSSRLVGEATYSVYLIHGIILFWFFRFLVGFDKGAQLTVNSHWLAVCGCIPVLLVVSCVTYRFVEAPAMQSVPKVTSRFHERLNRRTGQSSAAPKSEIVNVE